MLSNLLRNLRINELKKSTYSFKWIFCVLITFSYSLITIAEVEAITTDLTTPQNSVKHHFKYLQADNFNPGLASLAIYPGDSSKASQRLSIRLKQLFDGLGHQINTGLIPDNPNFRDSTSGNTIFIVDKSLSSIYIEKYNGKWMYSEESVKSIETLIRKVYPLGTHKLLSVIPHGNDKKFLGVYIWQLVAIFSIILISILIYVIFNFFFTKVLLSVLNRRGKEKIAKEYIVPIAKPFSLLIVFGFLRLFMPLLQLPISVSKYIIIGTKVLIPLFCIIICYKLVDLLSIYLNKLADKTESTLDDQLVPLIRKALKTFVVILGGLFILQNLDFNITALLAGVSIGGLALALAAQDMLKNFFGSIMIFIDRPFQIGDWVLGPDIDGDIEEVGFRSTRIRTFHNSLISVPNGQLADMTIDNMGQRKYRRYKTYLGLTYDTPTDKIELFIKKLEGLVLAHAKTRKDYYNIYFNSFNNSSLDILFYIFLMYLHGQKS